MAKEIRGDDDGKSTSFKDYVLLPAYTKKECTVENISIETEICGIRLKFPFMPAAMTSVTGKRMTVETARNGMMAFLPRSLPIEEVVDIIDAVKEESELTFHTFPHDIITARPEDTFENVYEEVVCKYGHSTIPIVDAYGKYLGVFLYVAPEKHPPSGLMKALMQPNIGRVGYDYCLETMSDDEVLDCMTRTGKKFMPILDKEGHLKKFAFKKSWENYYVAVSIDTYPGWEKKVYAALEAGADLISIDTSDAFNEFTGNVLKTYNKEFKEKYGVPICAGNIVTKEGFEFLVNNGADVVKVGMGIGSICTTTSVKGVGRGAARSLIEVVNARDKLYKRRGLYVPVIMDGSIHDTWDMTIALAMGANGLMMGNYFNAFYEAEGEALDANMNVIENPDERESDIRYKRSWGEGSRKAMNLKRYHHETQRTFFEEGVEGIVEYKGRLKPNVERDANIIKSAMSNAGCMNLKEFRENAILERLEYSAQREALPHGLISYKE